MPSTAIDRRRLLALAAAALLPLQARAAVPWVVSAAADFDGRFVLAAMDAEGFGACTNHGECEAACPAEIPLEVIARMNRDLITASLRGGRDDPE